VLVLLVARERVVIPTTHDRISSREIEEVLAFPNGRVRLWNVEITEEDAVGGREGTATL